MNKPLAITKRQAVALLKAAKEAGGFVEVNPLTGVVRLIPGDLHKALEPVDEEPKGHL